MDDDERRNLNMMGRAKQHRHSVWEYRPRLMAVPEGIRALGSGFSGFVDTHNVSAFSFAMIGLVLALFGIFFLWWFVVSIPLLFVSGYFWAWCFRVLDGFNLDADRKSTGTRRSD